MASPLLLQRLRAMLCGLACAAVVPAHAADFTVGPAFDADCQFNDLQAAIAAAGASPGADTLRVMAGVYTAQRLVIGSSGDLEIEGGHSSCSGGGIIGATTLDGEGASPAGPVISHLGNGNLILSGLEIRNGNATGIGGSGTRGGGLYSPSLGDVRVRRSSFTGNRAQVGGGMYAAPTTRGQREIVLEGVIFSSNAATLRGGGLFVANARLKIRGDLVNGFFGNSADGAGLEDGGGAIYAYNTGIEILSRALGNQGFISENTARSHGGGLYFQATATGTTEVHIGNLDSTSPLRFLRNAAGGVGGAMYLRANAESAPVDARLSLFNTIIEGNRADEGSAVFAFADGNETPGGVVEGSLSLRMDSRSIEGVNACPAAMRCNRIQGNTGHHWATVALESGSRGRVDFQFRRGYALDNSTPLGGGLVDHLAHGQVQIDSSVLANNDAGGTELLYSRGLLQVSNSTLADNVGVAPTVLAAAGNQARLQLYHSIVFQPGLPLSALSDGAAQDVANLLVGSGHGLGAGTNVVLTADPMFSSAATRDYSLRAGSPAIDRWGPSHDTGFVPVIDLRGAPRPSAPPGSTTPYDFGAFEFGAVLNERIYRNGFESLGEA